MKLRRTFLILIPIILIGLTVYYFTDIVAYILISWVLSMVGQPIMKFLTGVKVYKFTIGRTFSAIITILLMFLVFFGLSFIFIPLIIEQANNLAQVEYEAIFSTLEVPLNRLQDKLAEWGFVGESVTFSDFSSTFGEYFKPGMMTNIFSSIFGIATNFLIGLFSIVFITFFFLREANLFNNLILALVPDGYEKITLQVIEDITTMLRKYFGGILLQITIITTVVSIALSLLGVGNALLIGFFAALINVIPYVGPLIGAIFAAFIVVSSNVNSDFYDVLMPLLIKVAAVFAGMQMLDNFILQPFIYSKSVQAHPLEIFILILVAAKIGGILGMILAIPMYTVFRVIAGQFLSHWKIVQKITRKEPDDIALNET